jgi:hypothetical protein
MSLLGVVFAAAGSGLGEICYLTLASHYSRLVLEFSKSFGDSSGTL